jgi:alkylated DNA repair dioxygenase AlkB
LREQRLLPFAAAPPPVPGLDYVESYVTSDEERELLSAVDRQPWLTDWKRRRQVYGVAYSGPQAGRNLEPLPTWLQWLVKRVTDDGYLEGEVVNSVINEFLPGQGIAPHVDHLEFGPTVVAVSLGGAIMLDLQDQTTPGRARVSLDVQPRSLWVLGGEARSRWLHGIAPRHSDIIGGLKRPRERRVSITLRTLARQ